MPTGSRNPDVLTSWILDSMGLIRRKPGQWGEEEKNGALHRILREALLVDPLKGWNTNELGDVCGLSHTGTHHQISKLKSCGLVSNEIDGKWHVYVLRGGSISAAVSLACSQARAILEIRLSELSELVNSSESRMNVQAEEDSTFTITISEPGPRKDGKDSLDSFVYDLGLNGERSTKEDTLSRDLLFELSTRDQATTILSLSDRLSESRSRINRSIDRMRSAGLIERVPMVSRIPQDLFSGIMRQHAARGEEWLMSRGGLGRLHADVSGLLISEANSGTLTIEKVQKILSKVDIDTQRVLLNTIGGRMPYGVRISGSDADAVSEKVLRNADRTLRRLKSVSQRLDEALLQ